MALGKLFEDVIAFLQANKEPKREQLYDLLERAAIRERIEALSDASKAVQGYQPISAEGMTPVYRAAFEETRKGCCAKISELYSVAHEALLECERRKR